MYECITTYAPNSTHSVLPINFFAFGVGAAVVGDGDFVDADAATGDFGGDLRFEAEAVFLDGDALEDLASEGFIAGLHVREVEVGEHVGEKSKEAVADGMPEVKNAVGFRADEAGAEDDIGTILKDRSNHDGIFLGVVFEVGVLDDDDRCGGMGNPRSERGTFALIDFVAKSPEGGGRRKLGPETRNLRGEGVAVSERRVLSRKLLKNFPCSIGGGVVDDNEFRDV